MSKQISISDKVDKILCILREKYKDKDTGKIAPYNKAIIKLAKKAGLWQM